MNNKIDIEKDIKILNELINDYKFKHSSKNIMDKNTYLGISQIQAIENILADKKEKEQYISKIADMLNIADDQIPIELSVQLSKANKYDSLIEKIKEKVV